MHCRHASFTHADFILYGSTALDFNDRRQIIKAMLVIEIGEDKYGFTASARRNGTGRGRGRGRGGGRGGRGRVGAYGGPDDEMNSQVGWRHCHFMLLINCPDGFDSVLIPLPRT